MVLRSLWLMKSSALEYCAIFMNTSENSWVTRSSLLRSKIWSIPIRNWPFLLLWCHFSTQEQLMAFSIRLLYGWTRNLSEADTDLSQLWYFWWTWCSFQTNFWAKFCARTPCTSWSIGSTFFMKAFSPISYESTNVVHSTIKRALRTQMDHIPWVLYWPNPSVSYLGHGVANRRYG